MPSGKHQGSGALRRFGVNVSTSVEQEGHHTRLGPSRCVVQWCPTRLSHRGASPDQTLRPVQATLQGRVHQGRFTVDVGMVDVHSGSEKERLGQLVLLALHRRGQRHLTVRSGRVDVEAALQQSGHRACVIPENRCEKIIVDACMATRKKPDERQTEPFPEAGRNHDQPRTTCLSSTRGKTVTKLREVTAATSSTPRPLTRASSSATCRT